MFTVTEQNLSVPDLKNDFSDFYVVSTFNMSNLNISRSDTISDLPQGPGVEENDHPKEENDHPKVENDSGDRSDSGFGSSLSSQQSTPFLSDSKV